jgi:hypothetical protein
MSKRKKVTPTEKPSESTDEKRTRSFLISDIKNKIVFEARNLLHKRTNSIKKLVELAQEYEEALP